MAAVWIVLALASQVTVSFDGIAAEEVATVPAEAA
jgi:hypothetical protein